MSPDCIQIERLKLWARIGVPDEERARPQRLSVSLYLEPWRDFRALEDKLENTVDYYELSEFVKSFSVCRPRCLIETLAEEIANALLERYPLRAVDIHLCKFILPDTEYVAVKIRRERAG